MKLSFDSAILAVVLGTVISALLSSALVLAGLRAGITPGVSPLIVLAGWLLISAKTKHRSEFLLILHTTGSAGAAVTAGVIFTAPVIQIAAPQGVAPAVAPYTLMFASLAGALLGWGCVGLTSRQMVNDHSLPAPEAKACSELLQAANSDDARLRPNYLLSLILPGLLTLLGSAGIMLNYLRSKLLTIQIYSISIPIPFSPLYFGIGAILSIQTALLLALGGLGHAGIRTLSAQYNLSGDTFRWVGAAAMTVSILYTLWSYAREQFLSYLGSRLESKERDLNDELGLDDYYSIALYFSLLMGFLMAVVPLLGDYADLSPQLVLKVLIIAAVFLAAAVALSAIGALLSLQLGSSASPVSATVFVGMLCLALCFNSLFEASSIETVVYLLVVLCVAICAANDSSQDYRTLLLQKVPISIGYIPQLCGLLAAVLVVPPTLFIAHDAFYLGSEELPSPQASFFSVVLLSLLKDGSEPIGAIYVGIAIGLVAVLVEMIGKDRGQHLSSVSFAVGLYLPPVIGIGVLMGALCRWFAVGSSKGVFSTGILAAACLISFDAAASLGFGFANIMGYWAPGSFNGSEIPGLSWALFAALLLVLYLSFSRDSK